MKSLKDNKPVLTLSLATMSAPSYQQRRELSCFHHYICQDLRTWRMEDVAGLFQFSCLSSWIQAGKTFTRHFNVAGHHTMRGGAHCSDFTRCGSCWKHCFNYLWLKIKYLTPQVSGAPGRELAEAYGLTAQRDISDITHVKLIFVYFSCMQAMSNMRPVWIISFSFYEPRGV